MVVQNSFEKVLLGDNPVFAYRFMSSMPPICLASTNGIGANMAYNKAQNSQNAGYDQIPSDGIFSYSGMRFNGAAQGIAAFMPYASSLQPTGALTLVAVMSALRNTDVGNGIGIFSCVQGGGYGIYSDTNGKIDFYIVINHVYEIISIDNVSLSNDMNLIHCTFDGENILLYLNGSVAAQTSVTAGSTVTGNSAGWTVGSDSAGGSIDANAFADIDISNVALYGECLSQDQITAHYQSWSQVRTLSGTATLDNGDAATSIVIIDAEATMSAILSPANSGAWSANVPPGSYIVNAIGPAGYRPLAHGPISVS